MVSPTPGKESENGVYEFPYMRPQNNRSKWENLKLTIWDPSANKFLGRTAYSWSQILFFYAVFYTVLAALFAVCFQGLFWTLDDNQPKWLLDKSLIGTNPGLGFRPISNRTEEGSLIWFDSENSTSIKKWTDLLDEYLELYLDNKKLPGGGINQEVCDFNKRPGVGKVCSVDDSQWGPCSREHGYGYNNNSPCFFLKLNREEDGHQDPFIDSFILLTDPDDHILPNSPRAGAEILTSSGIWTNFTIFDWEAEYYNDTQHLPSDMPQDLINYISNISKPEERNQIWVSCEGENPADREHLTSDFEYFPTRGFASYYYPYRNVQGYLSPLVAVQVKHPTKSILINIECRAWAKNIIYRGGNQQREGSIHLEILMD